MANKRIWAAERTKIYPQVNREIAGPKCPRWTIGHLYELVRSVKVKCLPHFAGTKCDAVLQRSIIAALNLVGIAIARPPSDHVTRRRYARALTGAARVVDFLNFSPTKRAVKDLYFIDQPVKLICRNNNIPSYFQVCAWAWIDRPGKACVSHVNSVEVKT